VDEMNFSYGIIGLVGVLAAISIGFISMDPGDIIEPRIVENQWINPFGTPHHKGMNTGDPEISKYFTERRLRL